MRNHGFKNRDKSIIWGTNSRLDNLQAGFGNIMLKRISSWNKKQLNIARFYNKHLSKLVTTPLFDLRISNPSFHQYIIRTKYRDQLRKFFQNNNNIETAIHYPIPIHKQIAYRKKFGNIILPKTEKFSKEILSLPINPHMKKSEIVFVIKKIEAFLERKLMKNILITGGGGYIGTNLTNKLLNDGYNITVLDTFWFGNYLKNHKKLKIKKKDIRNIDLKDLNKLIVYYI